MWHNYCSSDSYTCLLVLTHNHLNLPVWNKNSSPNHRDFLKLSPPPCCMLLITAKQDGNNFKNLRLVPLLLMVAKKGDNYIKNDLSPMVAKQGEGNNFRGDNLKKSQWLRNKWCFQKNDHIPLLSDKQWRGDVTGAALGCTSSFRFCINLLITTL